MAERGSIFDDVKRQVDLVEYLSEHGGAEFVSDGGDRLAACCPFHEEDTPSFKVQDARSGEPWKVWHCFGACDDGGTIIDAVMRHQGFETAFEAIDYLNELYGLELQHDTERYQAFKKTTAEAKEKIDRTQAEMASESKAAQAAKAFLHRRGFTDDTIAHFELAVDTSRSRAGRLAIPIYDRSNHPITISNRALFDAYKCASCGEPVKAKEVVARRHQAQKAAERGGPPVDWEACPRCGAGKAEARISWLTSQHPKYLNERDYEKSKILYNEPTARKFLREDECLGYFIAEGYADVWATYQGGQHAASSYNGSTISDWQAEEAAELCAAQDPPKPIILIPDFDATGLSKISKNIATIRKVSPEAEIQVIHSLEVEGRPHKDMGEVLEEEGAEWVATICQERRISADEWLIREVMDAINPKTGQPFHSKERQMELISEILRDVHYVAGLDHMAPYLSEKWAVGEDRVRDFLYTQISDSAALPAQHLMKTVGQARAEAIEYLKDDFAISFGFDAIDRCLPMNGAKTRQLAMFIGKSGTGKAQPLDAKVLTPTGWRLMGALQPGDQVIDPTTGDPVAIQSIHPQGEREIYRVHMSDGASTECDLDHLWHVKDSNNKWRTRTLREIRDRVDLSKSPHMVPVTKPVQFATSGDLPLHPYLLGALLGDGSLSQGTPSFSSADPEIIDRVESLLPDGVYLQKKAGDNVDYWLTGKRKKVTNALAEQLRSLQVWGSRAETKHVPSEYLHASIEDRIDLLRGLMDTDGSVCSVTTPKKSPSVNVEFCTASKQLAEDMLFLVQSLGGTARISMSGSSYAYKGDSYSGLTRHRVRISMPVDINPFFVPRKADIFVRNTSPSRRMTKIEFSRVAEAQCLYLDSESHLYITDDFIVTHNTLITTQILANMARRGVRSIFFSLEQPAAQLYMRMVAQTLDVRMDEGIELIKENSPRLDELDELFENMIIVDNVPEDASAMVEMTPDRILKIIQEINLTKLAKPAQVVAIDHLGILQVPSTAPRSVQNDDMQAAGYIMQELFKVTKIADVLTLVLQQLPKEVRSGVEIAADQGRGGSKQTDYCDYIFTLWRPEQQEGLTDEDRIALEGRYMLALKKNRHGASTIANLYFDRKNLRITPALDIMPTNFGGGIDQTADGAPVVIGADDGGAATTDSAAGGAAEKPAADPSDDELLRELVDEQATDDPGLPIDNAEFMELLGGGGDDDDGDDPFGGMGADYFEN